jgi:hypothetical protein
MTKNLMLDESRVNYFLSVFWTLHCDIIIQHQPTKCTLLPTSQLILMHVKHTTCIYNHLPEDEDEPYGLQHAEDMKKLKY